METERNFRNAVVFMRIILAMGEVQINNLKHFATSPENNISFETDTSKTQLRSPPPFFFFLDFSEIE
jgi:hypothetical protein